MEESWLDKTRQTYHQTFNYIKLNQKFFENPLSKMLFEVKAFAECFDNAKEIIEKLERLYADPILYLVTTYPQNFSKRVVKRLDIGKPLPFLEWIFYRDSHRYTQLKRKYYIDEEKPSGSRFITFGDIAGLKGHVEKEISLLFNQVVKSNNFGLENPFASFPKVEQFDINEFGGVKSGS